MVFYNHTVARFILTYGPNGKNRGESARVSFISDDGGKSVEITAHYAPIGANLINFLNKKSLIAVQFPEEILHISGDNATPRFTEEQLESFKRHLPAPSEYDKLREFTENHLSVKPPRDIWLFPEELEYTCTTRLSKMGDGTVEYQRIFTRAYDLLAFEASELYVNGTVVRQCKNCGEYFMQKTAKEEVYCDRVFKDGKTCKQLGYVNTLSELDALYRTAYKTKYAWIKNHPELPWSRAAFKKWRQESKLQKEKCENGRITPEEYKRFLKRSLHEFKP